MTTVHAVTLVYTVTVVHTVTVVFMEQRVGDVHVHRALWYHNILHKLDIIYVELAQAHPNDSRFCRKLI